MAFVLARRLCVGNVAVPLVECKKDVGDPKEVGIGSHDDLKLLSLYLTGTRNRQSLWLAEALGLTVSTLRKALWNLPLIMAIRSETAWKKPRRGPHQSSQSAIERNPHLAIGLRVRGRILLVENSTKVLRLFFRPGEEEDGLKWLLNELVADVQGLKEKEGLKDQKVKDEPALDPHSDSESEPDSHQEYADAVSESIDQALSELKDLPGCASAQWLSSRSSFRVSASSEEGQKPKFHQKVVQGFKRKGAIDGPTDEDLITAIKATKDALKPLLM